jgi:hypothetical protein
MKRCSLLSLSVVFVSLGFAERDIKSDAVVEKRKAFAELNSPNCIRAHEDKNLKPDEEVLGVVRNGESCAYPLRMMAVHRIVNDHLGGPEILMTYCADSSLGKAFDPRVDNQKLAFDFYGYYEGVMLVVDRQTQSVWSALTGECLMGAMKGKRMPQIPTLITTWGQWKQLHGDSWVLAMEKPEKYAQKVVTGSPSLSRDAQRSIKTKSPGMSPNALVVGVVVNGVAKAYPYEAVEKSKGVIKDKLGDTSFVVFYDVSTKAAAAYNSVLNNRQLTFVAEKRGDATVFVDKETSSMWNIEGKAIDGLLKGLSLTPMNSLQVEWYAWGAYYPMTVVYRNVD